MTQTDLADAIGVEQQTISRIELGQPTTISTLAAICDVLSLNLDINVQTQGADIDRYEGAPELVQVARAIERLPPEQRRHLVTFLQIFPDLPMELRAGMMMQIRYWADTYLKESSVAATNSATV